MSTGLAETKPEAKPEATPDAMPIGHSPSSAANLLTWQHGTPNCLYLVEAENIWKETKHKQIRPQSDSRIPVQIKPSRFPDCLSTGQTKKAD